MKNTHCKVHRLRIIIDGPTPAETESPEFEECLTKKRPFEFLTCCSNLTHLDLTWYTYAFENPMDLQHFLGDFTWHLLSSVRLGNFRITGEAFVEFAARHSTSLDQLSLRHITLSEGDWYSTLKRMRKVLRLKKPSVSGVLYLNNDHYWWMYPDPRRNPGELAYGDYVKEYLEDHSEREMQLDVLVRGGHL